MQCYWLIRHLLRPSIFKVESRFSVTAVVCSHGFEGASSQDKIESIRQLHMASQNRLPNGWARSDPNSSSLPDPVRPRQPLPVCRPDPDNNGLCVPGRLCVLAVESSSRHPLPILLDRAPQQTSGHHLFSSTSQPHACARLPVDNPTRWVRANWTNQFEANALPMFCRCAANAMPEWKCQGTEPPGSAMGALPGLPHWLCRSPSLLSAQPARPITEGLLSSAATHAPPWATPAPPALPLQPPATPCRDRNAACTSGRIMPGLTSSAWILDT